MSLFSSSDTFLFQSLCVSYYTSTPVFLYFFDGGIDVHIVCFPVYDLYLYIGRVSPFIFNIIINLG